MPTARRSEQSAAPRTVSRLRASAIVPVLILGGAAVAFGLQGSARSSMELAASGGRTPVTTPTTFSGDVRATYLSDCAVCHGSDARGTSRGPSLVGRGRASVDYMLSTGRMPITSPGQRIQRHRPAYPPDVIHRLVDYIASLGIGGPEIPNVSVAQGSIAAGGELFRLQCAACHEWAGTGGALVNQEAPRITSATVTQIAEAVRAGPGTMPAFGPAALDQHQLDSVVAYVRTLAHPRDRGGYPLWHLGPLPEGGIAVIAGLGALVLATRWIGTTR